MSRHDFYMVEQTSLGFEAYNGKVDAAADIRCCGDVRATRCQSVDYSRSVTSSRFRDILVRVLVELDTLRP